MNKLNKSIAALLFSMLIILSVFLNTGITVRAQAVDYLNSLTVEGMEKDTGSSSYGTIGSNNIITGKSGAKYDNGVAVSLTRDCAGHASYISLAYKVKNNAATFASYLDLNKDSQNSTNFAVKFEVYTGDTMVYSQTLTPSSEYPVKINVPIIGAEDVAIKFSDTAANEGVTSFVLGNAAFCENGNTIPGVTVPTPEEDNDSPTTDLTADAQQLLASSKAYMGHNYLYVTMQLTWSQAATWCEMQGGYLATVSSAAENKFIAEYLRSMGNKSAYIGLENTANGSELKWKDGETAKYFNWGRDSITDPNAKYTKMTSTGEWTLGTGNEEYLNFIIEWGEKEVLPENGNTKKEKAVIVIAGLGGSVLSNTDKTSVWGRQSGVYTELDLDDAMVQGNKFTPAGSKYGLADTYKPLIEAVSKTCSDSDVFLYEWDWRRSGSNATDGLDTVIKNGGWTDVTLIGHNTGGLTALYYYGKTESNNVTKIITLGTPFYGTEKAFYMMKTGMFPCGTTSVRAALYDSVRDLTSLHSMIPEAPNIGTAGFTGELHNPISKDDAFDALGITRADSDSALLKNVYSTIKSGDLGGIYIVAGSGVPTVSGVYLDDDGGVSDVDVSLEGDGLTGVHSAAMNFESARPPYILENTSVNGLVTSQDGINLVCNILSGVGDTAEFSQGITNRVFRSFQTHDDKLTEISISGNARITVQTSNQTVTMSGRGYSFTGDPQCGFVLGESIKTIFVPDNAEINIEILGSDVFFEISGENGTASWSGLSSFSEGAVMKATAASKVLTVTADPASTGITEIPADTLPTLLEEAEKEEEQETEDDSRLVIPWNIWAAIGLVVAAAAVAMIMMPYFAYRVSKVETDRKKRMLKKALRQQRMQQNGQTSGNLMQNNMMLPPMTAIPPITSAQDGTISFDINDVV